MGLEIAEATFTDPAFLRLTENERWGVVGRIFADPVMIEFSRLSRRRGTWVFWRSAGALVAIAFGLNYARHEVPFSVLVYSLSIFGLSLLWVVGDVWLWVRWMKRESNRRMQSLLQIELDRMGARNRPSVDLMGESGRVPGTEH
ncbi:unnamed protein product [Gemmata massiliana]|uniref:Uncharacterized protein n=1 Tax=Gemmata massiliana TaxID=1210884 RepID=A0A6P2DH99_9BACT|nr:hypothetical protein [Gemmata massiliana]VTS02196.1 unnamed protein product [Gemmata massiliana]